MLSRFRILVGVLIALAGFAAGVLAQEGVGRFTQTDSFRIYGYFQQPTCGSWTPAVTTDVKPMLVHDELWLFVRCADGRMYMNKVTEQEIRFPR
jgi:hypothetical protein